MELMFSQYRDGLSDKGEKRFYTTLRNVLLPVLEETEEAPLPFLDRGLVYCNKDEDVIPINMYARRLLVKALLDDTRSLPPASLHTLIFTSQVVDNTSRGESFEELVMYQIVFRNLALETTDEYGKPIPGHLIMRAQDYAVLQKKRPMMGFTPVVPTLVRGYAQFPVWDFVYVAKAEELHMSTVVFIQCSVSAFRDHDQGTAEIKNAFVADKKNWGRTSSRHKRNCVEALLDECLGVEGHRATIQEKTLTVRSKGKKGRIMPNVHFLYITTGEPTGGSGHKYKNLRFIFEDTLPPWLKGLVETANATHETGKAAAKKRRASSAGSAAPPSKRGK
jgi:hypothetical protein